MYVGVAAFLTDLTPDVREVARAAEDLGFESLFVPEHTHIPTSRTTPYPAGGDLPEEYRRTLDPFVALTAAAVVTERIRLGTGACLVAEHDPVALAKAVSTLDLVSGGRVLLGVGAGWNVEELANHGVDAGRRWSVLRDRVQAMQRLWSDDVAQHHGLHLSLSPSWQWPKPVQRPGPPVLLAGGGRVAMSHAVQYADGWMPMPERSRGGMGERMAALREMAEAAGRPVPQVTAYAVRPDPQVLAHYAELGVVRCVLLAPSTPDLLSDLRRLATVSAALTGGAPEGNLT